jgi:SSS family solute:Na+ symporter
MTDPDSGFVKPDRAYPSLLNLLPSGLKGVAFAALTAAIVSSLASMANSTSTIFTMDIYRNYINKSASEQTLVRTGRLVVIIAFLIACLVAPALSVLGQAFQFIQEYTGFVSPGVFAIFVFGVFWKKTTPNAALIAAILTIPLSTIFKFVTPDLPFINRMGIVFLILAAIIIAISLLESKGKDQPNAVDVERDLFKTSPRFNIGAILVIGILSALYIIYW